MDDSLWRQHLDAQRHSVSPGPNKALMGIFWVNMRTATLKRSVTLSGRQRSNPTNTATGIVPSVGIQEDPAILSIVHLSGSCQMFHVFVTISNELQRCTDPRFFVPSGINNPATVIPFDDVIILQLFARGIFYPAAVVVQSKYAIMEDTRLTSHFNKVSAYIESIHSSAVPSCPCPSVGVTVVSDGC